MISIRRESRCKRLLGSLLAVGCWLLALTIPSHANHATQGGLGSTNPHVIPDSEYVMDELVTVHPYGTGGAITASPDGRYAFCAEGGAVALILADPTLIYPDPEDSFNYPIWRQPVGTLGVSPVELAVDPDMDFDSATYDPEGRETLIYIAGGRDGLWVMNASLDPHLPVGGWSPHKAFRIDDSGNMNRSTQNGRKFCNDVDFMTVGSKTYVLALFSRVDQSQLRVYWIEDVRDVAQLSSETGNELTPLIMVSLQFNPFASGDAYSLGMDVDEIGGVDEAYVYVAMGEHGIFRVPFQLDVGGDLISLPVEHGPYFGDTSPYVTHGNSLPDPDLYDTVKYYPENDDTQTAIFEHAPYFLDVAVENLETGRHRLYAAVDHLGWCAFNLDATWDDFIWSPPSSAAPGYPDFIQEGKVVEHNLQAPKKMIRLVDNPDSEGVAKKNSFAKRVEVVRTRKNSSSPESTALIVSAGRSRHIQGSGWNEGRSLQWDLNQGPVPNGAQPSGYGGDRGYVLAYELEHVGDNTAPSGTPYWEEDGYNFKGVSVGGAHIHAVKEQPEGELHLFYGQSVTVEKLEEPSGNEAVSNNMVRAWYLDWPDTIVLGPEAVLPLPTHDEFLLRGRYYRLGRFTLAFGPSKIDPNILVASANDAGCIPDGPLIFDPIGQRISAPFRSEGFVDIPDPYAVTGAPEPINQVPGFTLPTGQADDLNYGVLMNARGGFTHHDTSTQIDHEYRMGFSPRITGSKSPTAPETLGEWFKGPRWKANRFNATYQSGVVDSIALDRQLYMTPPSSKFSVSPYASQSERDKVTWSGKPYYSTTVTFPEYNAYVREQPQAVDDDGLLFATCNGSPQGLWVIAMSKLRLEVDEDPSISGSEFDRLFLPPVSATSNEIVRGALVTHPEFWNVPDTRTGTASADAHYFTQRLANHHIGETAVWHPDMFELPIPNTDPVEYAWILAVPCGFAVLSENDDKFFDPNVLPTSWYPDAEFREGVGYKHMMVRLFDVSDPAKISGVTVPASDDNLDSKDVPAFTLIGPAEETAAVFAKGIRVTDSQEDERFLLLVGDLGGKVYLYDIENLLVPSTTGVPAPGHDTKHYGWFFDDAPLSVYETQESLTDDHANGVWGCEVVQESWIDGNQVQQDETYVYLGVPRVGVEVLKLKFNASGNPLLEYLGLIQTPGHAITLYVEEFNSPPSGYEAWKKLLYVSDYHGGMRIYSHPVGGQ